MTSNIYLTQLKILYVEDDDDTRENLRQYLRKKAGKVITASDGEEGLKKYMEEEPDIVIADILLPGLSGIDMLKAIREAGGRAPFIITSSADGTDTIIEAVDIGIVKYVVKPIILDRLLDALNKIAEDIYRGKPLFNDPEVKQELEGMIKKSVTAFLKKTIGKGPRDVSVFISGDKIEVSAFDVMTVMEKTLMKDKHNIGLIEHLHKNYYRTVRRELEEMLSGLAGTGVSLKETDFSAYRAVDKLVFVMTDYPCLSRGV